jgi:D-alanyl-D-alanine carboxypeptidase
MSPDQIMLAVAITAAVLAVGYVSPAGQAIVQSVRGKFQGGDSINVQVGSSAPQTLIGNPNNGLPSDVRTYNRDLNDLHPTFRRKFDLWLKAARAAGWDVRVIETFRTVKRQAYLFSLNRPGKWVTSKTGKPGDESLHQSGVATDIVIYTKGVPSYNTSLYNSLYKKIPPGQFGLEPLWGSEWVHLQIKGGYATARALGIKPNVLVGSRAFA